MTLQVDDVITQTIEDFCTYIDPVMGRQMQLMADEFVEWEAEGPIIRDVRGREYVDGMTFGGVFGLGHRHPKVVAAVKAQLDKMPLSSKLAFNKPLADLGKILAQVTPGDLQYTFVTTSGTESIEVALKLARLATERPQIISTLNSFHGMSIACSSVSGISYWREGFFPLLEACTLVPYGDIDAMRRAVNEMTAAILVEPVQAGSGCTGPPVGYLRQIRELCDRLGIVMIVDEIQTGFGRTGKMFGVDHDGITPDIMCVGKFLGGGVMPIGAAVLRPHIQAAASRRPLFNNTTFGGNPLACAAAVAAVQTVLDEDLVTRTATLGDRLQEGLQRIRTAYPSVIMDLKGIGLMRSFVVRDLRQAFVLVGELINVHHTLLLSPVHTPTMFRVNPPMNVDEAFIDRLIAAIEASVATVAAMSIADLDAHVAKLQQKMAAMQ